MKKAIIIALSLLLVLAMFTSCDEPKHEHTWNEGEVTTKATCTEKGIKTYTCTACQETKTEEIPAIGHDEKIEIVEPGYLTEGSKTTICTRCELNVVEKIDRKDINGIWLYKNINEYADICIVLQNTPDLNTCLLYMKTKNPETVGDDSYYLIKKYNEMEYTLDFDNKTITVPKSATEDQTCPLSEKNENGSVEITMENMVIYPIGTGDWTFTVVPSHTFPTSAEETGYFWYELDETHHVCYYICTEPEHDGDVPRFAIVDESKTENHNASGEDGSCSVCGYKPE